jgi:hypothetical protein
MNSKIQIIFTAFVLLIVILIVFITIKNSDITPQLTKIDKDISSAATDHGNNKRVELSGNKDSNESNSKTFPLKDIVVKIVDEELIPIPAAEIHLLSATPQITLTSDQTGKTVINDSDVYSQTLSLKVIASKHFPFQGTLNIPNDGMVTVVLDKKLFITGCVIDESNQKLNNIKIRCLNADAAADNKTYSNIVLSASGGSFTHGPLHSGPYSLTVDDQEYMSEIVHANAGDNGVVISLSKNSALIAKILSKRNEFVYGADVSLKSLDGTFNYLSSKISDLNGEITFSNLLRGNYAISVKHDWYIDIDSQRITINQLSQEETVILEDNIYRISGSVFDAITRKGISGAPVVCVKKNPGIIHQDIRKPSIPAKTVLINSTIYAVVSICSTSMKCLVTSPGQIGIIGCSA